VTEIHIGLIASSPVEERERWERGKVEEVRNLFCCLDEFTVFAICHNCVWGQRGVYHLRWSCFRNQSYAVLYDSHKFQLMGIIGRGLCVVCNKMW